MLQVLGPIRVTQPGTPVRVTTTIQTNAGGLINDPANFSCYAALFQALSGNVAKVYIGLATLNRSTLVDVAAVLAVPTVNFLPSFGISLTLAPAGINLSDLYIDVDNGGEGCLVTLLIT